MSPNLQQTILRISRDLKDCISGVNKHLSFVVRQNRIISIGWNDYSKTHPLSAKLGHFLGCRHSEVHAYVRLRNKNLLPYCDFVNVRVNSLGEIGMSRPCENCYRFLCEWLRPKRLYYTNRKGQFIREW